MDFNKNQITSENGARAYFWHNDKIAENYNFYDYKLPEAEHHLIIEGSINQEFKQLVRPDVKGLSIEAAGNIDLKDILEFMPHVEVLYLQCESISQADILCNFSKLVSFSLTSKKNHTANFKLPAQLKVFSCSWKSKFQFTDIPLSISLEYLFLEKAKNIDFKNVLHKLQKLVKLDLIDCELYGCINEMIDLKFLRYVSLFKCSDFKNKLEENVNTSLKYLNLSKVSIDNIEWIRKFSKIEVLILEDCGSIKSMESLRNVSTLRGLWISGNTKSLDGNFSWLENLTNLQNLFIRHFSHYSHKSISPWSWKKFAENQKHELYKRK